MISTGRSFVYKIPVVFGANAVESTLSTTIVLYFSLIYRECLVTKSPLCLLRVLSNLHFKVYNNNDLSRNSLYI